MTKKILSLILVLSLVTTGCSSIAVPLVIQEASPFTVALSSARYLGHACPVAEHIALTSRHLVLQERSDGREIYSPYIWSDSFNGLGRVVAQKHEVIVDLAVVATEKPFQKWFPVAKTPPTAGDDLFLIEFLFDENAPDPMAPRIVKAKMVSVFATQVNFKPSGTFGSSGSCIFNVNGEVVAINQGSPFGSLGHGVAVYGDFLDFYESTSPSN